MNVRTKNFVRARFADPRVIRPRFDAGAHAFWHFWDDYYPSGLRVCDALGVPLLRYTDRWPERAQALLDRPGFQDHAMATAYVAHFQFKSEADFARRVARGGNESQQAWSEVLREGRHEAMLAENDAVEDTYLRDFWSRRQLRRRGPVS